MTILIVLFLFCCAFASFIMLLLKWAEAISVPWWVIGVPIAAGYAVLILVAIIFLIKDFVIQRTKQTDRKAGKQDIQTGHSNGGNYADRN